MTENMYDQTETERQIVHRDSALAKQTQNLHIVSRISGSMLSYRKLLRDLPKILGPRLIISCALSTGRMNAFYFKEKSITNWSSCARRRSHSSLKIACSSIMDRLVSETPPIPDKTLQRCKYTAKIAQSSLYKIRRFFSTHFIRTSRLKLPKN